MNQTEEQRAIIEAPKPTAKAITVILAMAGTGKTTTTALRIRALIDAGHDPESIYAVTFTRAGGTAIQRRVGTGLGYSGTLHGLAMRELGISVDKILSEEEAEAFYKAQIEEAKLKGFGLGDAKRAVSDPLANGNGGLFVKICRRALRLANRTTFDFVLRDYWETLESGAAERPGFLFVDEAQDTGPMDAAIYEALNPFYHTVFIGDINQAIYGFRGAEPRFLARKATRAEIVYPLTVSFRCATAICRAANAILGTERKEWCPEITPAFPEPEGLVQIRSFDNQRAEEEALIDWAAKSADACAILCRYNSDVDRIRMAFKTAGFDLEPQIRAQDDTFRRAAIEALRAIVTGQFAEYMDALELSEAPRAARLRRRWQSPGAMQDAVEQAQGIRAALRVFELPAECFELPGIAKIGEEIRIDLQTTLSWTGPPQLSPREALETLLEGGGRVDDTRGIHVDTIHAAKGREWPRVALACADETLDGGPGDTQALNLVYVAATRAKRELLFTFSRNIIDAWKHQRKTVRGARALASVITN